MFRFLRNKRLFMLMVGFLVFIVLIGLTIGGRDRLTTPEQFLKDTVSTLQGIIYKPAAQIAGFFKDVRQLDQIYAENEELRKALALYTREKVQYNFIQSENERLQEALDFRQHQKELYDYNYLIAQVVAVSNDANNRTININLGSKHGVEKNMAVITVDGLVGIVTNVSPFSASVTPFTELNSTSNTFNAISATVFGKEDVSFGVLTDYDVENERIVMSKIDENDPIVVGDTVITSGLGNVYPRGLLVGKVETIKVGDFGLTHVATIEPFAKLDHLTEVFVVQMKNTINQNEQQMLEQEQEVDSSCLKMMRRSRPHEH